ncbi:MAG: ATPase, T2SS/T4P/T4SS family [Candidatus Micrarchaeota archaeon]
MEELGWATFGNPSAGYSVGKAFDFSAAELRAFSSAMSELREGAPGEPTAFAAVVSACEKLELPLSRARAELVAQAAELNLNGSGILGLLMDDEDIEEIAVIGIGKPVRVYLRGRGWRETDCMLASEEFAVNAVNSIARPLGRRLTYSSPRLNAGMRNMRLHASMPPLSREIEITIRKFTAKPMPMAELVGRGMLTAEQAELLGRAVARDTSVLVAGNTGSGKTTLLNALFEAVPRHERIILIEETPELRLPHEHLVGMVSQKELGISMASLVEDSLRMRPDRVVIGEVRAPEEVRALFDSLLAGQAKSAYSTFHANSAAESLERLVSLGARREELDSLGLIVVCKRATIPGPQGVPAAESRRVTEIAEVRKGRARRLSARR